MDVAEDAVADAAADAAVGVAEDIVADQVVVASGCASDAVADQASAASGAPVRLEWRHGLAGHTVDGEARLYVAQQIVGSSLHSRQVAVDCTVGSRT